MTIINFEHKFIFIKTRKTASTSVEAFLRRFSGAEDVVTQLTPRDEKWCAEQGWPSRNYAVSREVECQYVELCQAGKFDEALKFIESAKRIYVNHMPAHKVKQVLERQGYRWEDFYSFSIERHPYSWMLSYLLYDNASYNASGVCSLDLNDINRRAVEFLESDGFAGLLNCNFYAWGGRCLVNKVMRYENLRDDVCKVLAPLVGEPDMTDFPFLKKNANHLSPVDIFSPSTLDLIRKKCGQVLELAGYDS